MNPPRRPISQIDPPFFLRGGVIVPGRQAALLCLVWRKHWDDVLEPLPWHARRDVEVVKDALEAAASVFRESLRGTAEPTPAVPALESTVATDKAAELLGCSPRYVRRLISEGRLSAIRTTHGWQVDSDSLATYKTGR